MGDFLKECKRKHAEGKTDFVPGLIMYATILEKEREFENIKKERNDRKLQMFSGNY